MQFILKISFTFLNIYYLAFGKLASLSTKPDTEASIIVTWREPDIGGGVDIIEKYVMTWNSSTDSDSQDVEFEKIIFTKLSGLVSNAKYDVYASAFGNITGMGDLSHTTGITGN